MKQIIFSMLALIASVTHSFAAGGAPASPEVHADRTVTFRISAPNATNVTVTCDWLATAPKLTKSDSGLWSVTLGPLAPSTYIYTFNVDGVAVADPINPRIKLRARGSGSLVVVPAEIPSLQEARDVPHGSMEANWLRSAVLGGETRRFIVYTPPGYAANARRRYPVLLLLHGSNDTPDGWTIAGNLNFIADNLIAEGKMMPMVIVMPGFYSAAYGQGGGGPGNNATYYKYLLDEVLPMIHSKYRTAEGRNHHAVAGFSMGANQAYDMFFNHFELFSSVGALSPSSYRPLETGADKLLADPNGMNAKTGVFWIGCGSQDPTHFDGAQRAADVLTAHHINHIWHPTDGMHNYAAWRDYLVEFLPLLFQSPESLSPAPPRPQYGKKRG